MRPGSRKKSKSKSKSKSKRPQQAKEGILGKAPVVERKRSMRGRTVQNIWTHNLPTTHYDLWSEKATKIHRDPLSADKLPGKRKLKRMKIEGIVNGKLRIKEREPVEPIRPRSDKSSSKAPSKRRAVELPHGGMSYNPDETARQQLRDSAAMKLEKAIDHERRWTRKLEVDPKVKALQTNEVTDKGWSEDELVSEVIEPRKQRKKTPAEQNRKRRALREARREKRDRKENRRLARMDRVDAFAAELAEKKAIENRLSEAQKAIKVINEPYRVRNMGGVKYRFKAMPVLNMEDVKKNLRRQEMNSSGANPLEERYEAYLKRNMLQPKRRKGERLVPKILNKKKSFYVYST